MTRWFYRLHAGTLEEQMERAERMRAKRVLLHGLASFPGLLVGSAEIAPHALEEEDGALERELEKTPVGGWHVTAEGVPVGGAR